jgi:hypothetical protein
MSNAFNVQSKLLRVLALSAYKQTDFGVAVPAADLTHIQRFDGSAVPDYGTERRSDRGMSGKGYSFATNSQPTMFSTKIAGVKVEATDWISGWVLSLLMGKVVTTGAGPYVHTITFDETTRTAIPTTVYMQDTADVAESFLDMMPTSATFTIPAKGSVSLEFDLLGTGQKVSGLLPANTAVLPTDTYLMGNDAQCTFGPVGAPANFIGRFMSGTIKLDNQGMVHEAPGGGLYGVFMRRGDPKFSLSIVIAATNIDDVLVHFLNNDFVSFNLPINSAANCQLNFSFPKANLKTTKLGFDGDMPIWNLELDETTVYQNGAVPPVTVTVTSTQPTWLTTPPVQAPQSS